VDVSRRDFLSVNVIPMIMKLTTFRFSHDNSPGCIDNIKRNWHEISLAFRFSTHRAKKKVERKVRNM
jgi:hypothetical protein